MIRVGLVGCGFIGMVHSYALKALRDAGLIHAQVVAVCDRDPDRASSFARAHGAEVTPDVDTTVAACDALWVCTPTAEHLDVVEAAARAGRAVFCEKPLGRDLAEARRVAGALASVPHQVGLVLRHAPVFRALADHLDGRHGRVMGLTLRDDQYFPIGGMYASDWRADRAQAGSGVLLEHSIHDLDLFDFLLGPSLGPPTAVSCRTAEFAGHDGVEDAAAAHVVFGPADEPVVAALTTVWHQVPTRPSTRRIEVFCEQAFLWANDDLVGPLHVETAEGEQTDPGPTPDWVASLPVPDDFRKPLAQYAGPAKSFLDALAAGREPAGPGAEDALAAHRLCHAAYESAAQGGAPVTP